MKLQIKKDSTNVTLIVFIQDSSSTTGAGLTGLVYNSASLVCYYARPLAAAAALTLATQTVAGAHSDGGFVEIDSTNMPGMYRLDLSDAIVATGVDSVALMLKGATNMAPLPLEIQLTGFNLDNATPDVNVTQLSGVAQSLIDLKDFADAGYDPATNKVEGCKVNNDMRGTDSALLASSAPTNWSSLSITAGGLIDITQAAADKVWSTAARTLTSFGTLIQDIWDKATSALTTAGSIGKLFVDNINATIS
ncbi:MAG TPA: hypothetical protein ENH47_00955, partial [Ignavibacteriales bacterium]|nr:hypothetical protein [Ignavibacteriales bacterium]